jgi:hypothetical protein
MGIFSSEWYTKALLSMKLAVAGEERRSRRCEKLTPRRLRPLDLTTTGGLLGQSELPIEERDIDRRLMDTERSDGTLRFDEPRDKAELRLELLRRARIRKELPVV